MYEGHPMKDILIDKKTKGRTSNPNDIFGMAEDEFYSDSYLPLEEELK